VLQPSTGLHRHCDGQRLRQDGMPQARDQGVRRNAKKKGSWEGCRHDVLGHLAEMRASSWVPCDSHICVAMVTMCTKDPRCTRSVPSSASRSRPYIAMFYAHNSGIDNTLRQARRRHHAARPTHWPRSTCVAAMSTAICAKLAHGQMLGLRRHRAHGLAP
jgi:hypothetical protein